MFKQKWLKNLSFFRGSFHTVAFCIQLVLKYMHLQSPKNLLSLIEQMALICVYTESTKFASQNWTHGSDVEQEISRHEKTLIVSLQRPKNLSALFTEYKESASLDRSQHFLLEQGLQEMNKMITFLLLYMKICFHSLQLFFSFFLHFWSLQSLKNLPALVEARTKWKPSVFCLRRGKPDLFPLSSANFTLFFLVDGYLEEWKRKENKRFNYFFLSEYVWAVGLL